MLLDLLPPRERKDHLALSCGRARGVPAADRDVRMTLLGARTSSRRFRGMVVLDDFALFFNARHRLRDRARASCSRSTTSAAQGHGVGRVLHPGPARRARHDADGLGRRPDHRLPRRSRRCRLALYVLAGFFRTASRRARPSMKYFLLGAFASGLLPLRHRAHLRGHRAPPTSTASPAAVAAGRRATRCSPIGFGLLLVGFGFKISAVPFHMWAPDVYEGAPTVGHGVHRHRLQGRRLRARCCACCSTPLRGASADWPMLVWVLAALTHDGRQRGRARPAEPQAHARRTPRSPTSGYMLVGVVAGGSLGAPAACSSTCSCTRSPRRAPSA